MALLAASSLTICVSPVHLEPGLAQGDGIAMDVLCTQESNAPMVQIGDSHASMNVQPVGHSVRFITSAKIKWPSLRLDARPTGRAMMVLRIRARF